MAFGGLGTQHMKQKFSHPPAPTPSSIFNFVFVNFKYVRKITSKSIEAIKVCGITYSDNEELAYEKNITDKILKLENQIKR